MSETEKKSKRRKERGINVRVVQEEKEKKPDSVRVNTRTKKTTSRKKSTKKATAKKTVEKTAKKVTEKTVKKVTQKSSEEIELNEFQDLAWKKEEPEKQPTEHFETLILHTSTEPPKSRVIKRDVAKEKPVSFTRSVRETPFIQPKQSQPLPKTPLGKLPERPVVVRPVTAPTRPVEKLSAKEIKEREIEKAVNMATKLPQARREHKRRSRLSSNFGVTRAVLAVACLSTAVFAIVYFVNLNSSDVSLKVAAMQSGIEAIYPSYIPRGYALADVTSSSGKVTMKFKSDSGGYSITEEQSDWNSAGVLGNFVKPTYDNEYTVVEEQGLTIYMGDRWAAWVNGGILYKLNVDSGSLTKKQIKTISTSM